MNWKAWIYSLVSAAIGGAAGSLGAFIVAPEVFNFTQEGVLKMEKLALFGAVVPVLMLLKQSPLPAFSETTTATVVSTKEVTKL